MIFERAARREFAHAAAGIIIALLAILTSIQLIRLLKDAAGGKIAPDAVAALLGFSVLGFLPVMLSVTLFVAVVLVLSRSYRDTEMHVWLSSGLPLTAWMRPVVKFALPIIIAIAVVSGFLAPWASLRFDDFKERMAARTDISIISPGTFKEVQRGQRVFFVEELSATQDRFANVFVASLQDGKLGVVMSSAGYQQISPEGERFLVLENGRRYEVEPGSVEFKTMEFERYQFRTEDAATKGANPSLSQLPLDELLQNDSLRARAELLWRIGIPVSTLILALMAIPLSYVNPRAGRSANLLLAIFIYAIYNNLLSLSQAWVAQGKLSFGIGVWAIHGLMLVVLYLLFYKRMAVTMPWRRKS